MQQSENGELPVTPKRKLIEVALPLEVINRESAREKSIRHGHPSTLHLWWARRPLAAARAVLFAQLVDDPSSHPEQFPTEELQREERERLHRLIERLVVWENVRDEKLLAEAREEILKSTDGNPPPIVDPFAGGGTIPLEAQRLGLEAHASDLNPVAVLINKALIEFPPKFAGRAPVFPGLAASQSTEWTGARGLAADVRAYGEWMRDEAEARIGSLYPKADGRTVIAWIWARTVTCPNPGCGIDMPLVRSWWLGKKKGKEAYVVAHPPTDGSKKVRFEIGHDPAGPSSDGTVGRTGAECVRCRTSVDLKYVREEARAGRMGQQLMAVVAEGDRRRVYLHPSDLQMAAARLPAPETSPIQNIPAQALGFRVKAYGMDTWADLFTNRQLVALTTFSDLVGEARERVFADALEAGLPTGERLDAGGTDAAAYADAVAVYLGLVQSKITNLMSSITTWMSDRGAFRETFARQAIPMAWDFAESNALGDVGGGWLTTLDKEVRVIQDLPLGVGYVSQLDAARREYTGSLLSTDPPYYDNIGYSDLSDFFYVWQRRTLRGVLPSLFETMLVPKADELVANPYRHGGKGGAKDFFEDGFREVFARTRESAMREFPITVYYAFKQSETDSLGESSSGWETLLDGMVHSKWQITSTWPMRTEGSGRLIAKDTNALASSIVLSLRPRPDDAPTTDRRGFIAALEAELPDALRKLQEGQVAPVDLPQAVIGPGMAVFSRYSAVLEPDGTKMTVRSALVRINEILDQVLNEQEGDFDAPSRFAIAWYRQHGYGVGAFGDANSLANARNTTVDTMDRDGILTSLAGKVQLIKPGDLDSDYDPVADLHTSNWEALHHLIKVLEHDGVTPAGAFLRAALTRPDAAVDADLVKELAHLLFRVAEANGWTKDALSFNNLVTTWPEILDVARTTTEAPRQTQSAFDFSEDES
ncbi:putative DNA methylase [Branchiibius hedensis]|uniref:Putative DNA methylase n=1 Tax=Branchiibius hedensis TaxID=672460 RepID=A0A2Y8ZYQ5_9MICO|nr:DUF1156 domain-containing protein [Branchiibius hedensis]PWJ26225.1 putative DNA methylase [Branchiibius hedensis]SSA35037.1 putative DNA methylase [Branchiibius hedensis]